MADFKTFRKLNKLTQQQAADYFGCLQSFISQIETGRSVVPESFISKILAEGIYILPDNMSRETMAKSNVVSNIENNSNHQTDMDKDKYIKVLESLLDYKDKEIADLIAMVNKLQSEKDRTSKNG